MNTTTIRILKLSIYASLLFSIFLTLLRFFMTWLLNIRVHLRLFFNHVDSENLSGNIFQSIYIYLIGVIIVFYAGFILHKLTLYFFRFYNPFIKESDIILPLILIAIFYLNFFKSNYLFGNYKGVYVIVSEEGLKGEPSSQEYKGFVCLRSDKEEFEHLKSKIEKSTDEFALTRYFLFSETANFDGFHSVFKFKTGLVAYLKTIFFYLIEQLILLLQFQFLPFALLSYIVLNQKFIDSQKIN